MLRNRLSIAVVTDGRPGNRVQADGLAQAITRLREADIVHHDVEVNPFWRKIALHLTRRGFGKAPHADLVIGAGRRGNIVAAQSRRAGAKAIAILNPGTPLGWFDLVIAPEHDAMQGDTVLTTLGSLNTMTAQRIAQAAQTLPPLPAKALVVLVGGPSKSASFAVAETERLLADIARFAAASYKLHITPSRRTPDDVIAAIRAQFPDAQIWDGISANPYPGWLHNAAAILVTRDSVNMASEAAATGLPVFISGAGRIAPKFAKFHAALAARGITRDAANGPAHWDYIPLNEADRIAPIVLDRLGL